MVMGSATSYSVLRVKTDNEVRFLHLSPMYNYAGMMDLLVALHYICQGFFIKSYSLYISDLHCKI